MKRHNCNNAFGVKEVKFKKWLKWQIAITNLQHYINFDNMITWHNTSPCGSECAKISKISHDVSPSIDWTRVTQRTSHATATIRTCALNTSIDVRYEARYHFTLPEGPTNRSWTTNDQIRRVQNTVTSGTVDLTKASAETVAASSSGNWVNNDASQSFNASSRTTHGRL